MNPVNSCNDFFTTTAPLTLSWVLTSSLLYRIIGIIASATWPQLLFIPASSCSLLSHSPLTLLDLTTAPSVQSDRRDVQRARKERLDSRRLVDAELRWRTAIVARIEVHAHTLAPPSSDCTRRSTTVHPCCCCWWCCCLTDDILRTLLITSDRPFSSLHHVPPARTSPYAIERLYSAIYYSAERPSLGYSHLTSAAPNIARWILMAISFSAIMMSDTYRLWTMIVQRKVLTISLSIALCSVILISDDWNKS